MGLRSDMRDRVAGRRGRARGTDHQRVRRDTQAGTTLEDFGSEFTLVGGVIRLRLGDGLSLLDSTGAVTVDLDLEAILPAALDAILSSSRGLKVRGGRLELVKMDVIDDADEATPTAAENAAKINELLAALRATDRLRE